MKQLLLSMLMSLLYLTAEADVVKINGFYYVLDGELKFASVSNKPGYWKCYSGNIVIPEKIVYEGTEYTVNKIGDDAFRVCEEMTSCKIPNTIKSIGNESFVGCKKLKSIEIPESVESIGNNAFANCVNLSNIILPTKISKIGYLAFSNTAWYEKIFEESNNGVIYLNKVAYSYKGDSPIKIEIIEGTLGIASYAFRAQSNLYSVVIPKSLLVIGEGAFGECNSLTAVHISDLAAWCKIIFSGNPLYYAHHLYLNGKEINDLIIPNSVTNIGRIAFSGCSSLTSVTIPNSVTSIGDNAFEGCSNLTSVTIPSSVASIGGGAFSGCSGLTSISIPNSVTTIRGSVFKDCSSLTSITIPNSVTNIEGAAFYRCSSLSSIAIPNSVTSIGNSAFYGCSSLTSIAIPNSVTSIGEQVFANCSNVTSLKLPNNLQLIKQSTFQNCRKLKSVTIPPTVEVIYQNAFNGCYSLESVTAQATTPPFAYDNSFSNYNIPLYVPETVVESYKTTNPWSKFAQFKTLNGADVEVKKCEKPTIRYENGEISFSCETEGVEFVSSITDSDIKDYNVARIPLNVTYTISVHATKAGYEDSDVATATLCWIDKEPSTEGITSIAQIRAKAIMIQNNGNVLTIQDADENTPISVFEINGTLAGTGISRDGTATVTTNLRPSSIAIVKIGDKSVKVMMK